jgi:transglutaminase/protease-like cytokinesis protein 3
MKGGTLKNTQPNPLALASPICNDTDTFAIESDGVVQATDDEVSINPVVDLEPNVQTQEASPKCSPKTVTTSLPALLTRDGSAPMTNAPTSYLN